MKVKRTREKFQTVNQSIIYSGDEAGFKSDNDWETTYI